MFCPYCGKQIDDKAAVCLGCGRSVQNITNKSMQDSSSAGWWWLGFLCPIVGFILWCVWTGSTPMRAKRVGWGALIGVITSIVLIVLYYILVIFSMVMFSLNF